MTNCPTPATHMPWPVAAPFRMQPGFARRPGPHETPAPRFVRDALAPAYALAKAEGGAAAWLGEADARVLHAVAQAYAAETGVVLPAEPEALAQGMQEDIVVLHDEVDAQGVLHGRVRGLSVAFPSGWRPQDKLGLDFAAIHAPVADNALLLAGARGIMDLAFRQAPMLRHVWLLTPDPGLSQHPDRPRRTWAQAMDDAGPQGLLTQVHFRVERQTTLPLPAWGRGVFLIRVQVAPLVEVLAQDRRRALELHAALASMSPAVLDYRGMTAAQPALLRALEQT